MTNKLFSFKHEIKYFQYSPGIPWQLAKSKVVIPRVNGECVSKLIKDKNINVISYSGLIEAFFSLSIFEYYNKFMPYKKLYWSGNKDFEYLLSLNKLSKLSNIEELVVKNYTIPLFLDKEDGLYFNCMNNYLRLNNYKGQFIEKNRDNIFKQIFDNSLIKWDKEYIPKIRNDELSQDFITQII